MTQQADFNLIKLGFMRKARTLTDLFVHEWQVTDDEAAANRGAIYWLILRPGAAPITPVQGMPATKKIFDVNWNIVFDIQLKYKSFKESWSLFGDMRDVILNTFHFTMDKSLPADPLAPGYVAGNTIPGIWDITITAPEPPGQKPPTGAPTWVGQQLIAVIKQRIDVSR